MENPCKRHSCINLNSSHVVVGHRYPSEHRKSSLKRAKGWPFRSRKDTASSHFSDLGEPRSLQSAEETGLELHWVEDQPHAGEKQ